MRNILNISLLILLSTVRIYAQDSALNTAIKNLPSSKPDSNRVVTFCRISSLYVDVNADSAQLYAQRAMNLALQLKFEKGIAMALLAKGSALEPTGKYSEALNYYLQSLSIIEKLHLHELRNRIFNSIGIVYLHLDNYPNALKYFSFVLNDVRHQKILDESAEFRLMVNIAEVFKDTRQLDSAILYNNNAFAIAKRLNNPINEAITLFNIADNYLLKKDYPKALSYLNQSFPISKRIGDNEGISDCFNDYSTIYYQTGSYQKSIVFAQKSLTAGKNLNNYENTKTSYNLLYLNYKKIGDLKKALNYRNQEISLSDSLNVLQKERQIENIEADYEVQKKQSQINLLEKEKIIQEKTIENEKYTRLFEAVSAIILLALIFFLYRSNGFKKKLNQQLSNQNNAVVLQNQQLEKLNETKNVLFSIIGHDLRGPFAYLLSMIDLMKDKAISPDEQDYFLSKLSENILVTDHLLNNLLYWAKSQMDGFTSNKVVFDIQQVVAQNIKLLKSRAAKKGIEISQQAKTDPLSVYADEAMIDLVIRNLIENAMKFSTQEDTIRLDIENDPAFIKLAIIDSGKGIALEDQPKIFNKLSSFTTYGTNNEKGSGLGLLLCKELLEKNDGLIWFESKPGAGSTFYITIPKPKAALPYSLS